MINTDRPVIFDCLVDKEENCFPMIPSESHIIICYLVPRIKKNQNNQERKNFNLMTNSRSAYSTPGKQGKFDTHIIVVWVDIEAGVFS